MIAIDTHCHINTGCPDDTKEHAMYSAQYEDLRQLETGARGIVPPVGPSLSYSTAELLGAILVIRSS